MAANPVTVMLPEPLLKEIRGRARRAKRTVEAEVVELLNEAICAGGTALTNGTPAEKAPADPADRGKEPPDDGLPPDIVKALAEIERLDDRALRKAARPGMTPRQAERLAVLNRKAQAEGLSDAEERERVKLLHVYEKAVVVRAKALAELHKRGVDVSELIAQ